jgi:glycosyltransferase involved in cell wall biosynthesis
MVGPFGLRPKGTVSARALPLARALVRRGHHVEVLIPPWNYPQDSGRVYDDRGVRIRNVVLPPAVPLLGHAQITRHLLLATFRLRPDVVHTFKPKAYAGLISWIWWHTHRLGRIKGRLVVDTDDWEGPGGWNDLEPYSRLQRVVFARQERWGLTHADAVTTASRTLETLVWSLGAPRGKVFYLPNGVEPSAPPPRELLSELRARYGLDEHPVVLLYTRFFEFDLARVIAAWRQVMDHVPTARLLVVGKGLFGEEERFRRLVSEAGLADSVIEAGWVEAEEIAAHLAVADVAIYPLDDTLLNRTKCPVKLAELLAAGAAVVAERVGQVNEYIEPGRTGLLIPSGQPDQFAAAVVSLLSDPAARSAIGRAAREHMAAHFSWDRLAAIAESAYRA